VGEVLARGAPDEVHEAVRLLMESMEPPLGFVASTGYNAVIGIPARNLRAFVDAVREYGAR